MNRRPRLGLIAFEYPPLVGGMATYARALARHMHGRGWQVHVFANRGAGPDDELIVHPLLTADLARDLPQLARFRMDVWHAINFGYAPLAGLRRPFVLTVHGTDFLTPWVRCTMDRLPLLWRAAGLLNTRTAQRAVYAPALRCVDQVLTCSRFSARLFKREYPSAGSVRIVPNGVDEWFFHDGGANGTATRRPRRLLTVSNLDVANRRKNVDGVLRAVAMVGEQLDLEYWIIGDGTARPALEELARRLNVAPRVRFLGRVGAAELRDAYASAGLFVLVPRPQAGDVEGFGIVYLEAAAAGTPVLAGRYGGAGAAVAEGQSGFFAADSTPTAIADALTQFCTGRVRFDPHEVRGHAARYTWPKVLEDVERVYARLVKVAPISPAPARPIINPAPAPEAEPSTARQSNITWSAWIRRRPRPALPSGGGRVLLISYPFPPIGGSAVQRPAKLAKYLPACGWTVEVLTAAHDRFPWRDDSLCADVPAGGRVQRVAGGEPACVARHMAAWLGSAGAVGKLLRQIGNFANGGVDVSHAAERWLEDRLYWRMARQTARLGLGNGESLWVAPAVRSALARHRQRPFDALISTGPPHFVHRVALRVACRTGLPWIADLRDPLLSDFDRSAANHRHSRAMRQLERAVMHRAAVVVATCQDLADDLLRRYPHRSPNDVRVITNGFDRADLAALAAEGVCKEPDCVFVAAGSFYGRREISRLVEPLQRVLDRRPPWAGRVRLVIAGTIDAEQRRQWERLCPTWLFFRGYVDHAAAVRLAASAACAIVVVPDCRHGRLSIPGKTFELLAIPTHLLALAPSGSDTERLTQAAGGCTVASLEDSGRIAEAMEQIIGAYFDGALRAERDWPALDKYDRRMVAARFAECLSAASGQVSGYQGQNTVTEPAPTAEEPAYLEEGEPEGVSEGEAVRGRDVVGKADEPRCLVEVA